MTTTIVPQVEKSIRFNKANRDYDCYLVLGDEENYLGSVADYSDAEHRCNDAYYDLLNDGMINRECDLTAEEADELAPVVAAMQQDAARYEVREQSAERPEQSRSLRLCATFTEAMELAGQYNARGTNASVHTIDASAPTFPLNETTRDAMERGLISDDPREWAQPPVSPTAHALADTIIATLDQLPDLLPFEPTQYPRNPRHPYGPLIDPAYTPCEPLSTLADGTTVYGHYDRDDSHFTVAATLRDGWEVNADSNGIVNAWHMGLRLDLDELTLEKIQALKVIVNSGALEHLLACGAAWEGKGTMPVPQAPTATVEVSRYACPDTGVETSTLYTLGTATLDLPDSGVGTVVCLKANDDRIEGYLCELEPQFWDALPDAAALLNSPKVQHALEAQKRARRREIGRWFDTVLADYAQTKCAA